MASNPNVHNMRTWLSSNKDTSPISKMRGHVASTNVIASAIKKTPKAKAVKNNLFVFRREYANTAKIVRNTAKEIPPICSRMCKR